MNSANKVPKRIGTVGTALIFGTAQVAVAGRLGNSKGWKEEAQQHDSYECQNWRHE